MFYLNGDNDDINPGIMGDFAEVAEIGSTERVHLVVQLDRYKKPALRFHMTQGVELDEQSSVDGWPREVNMVDGATLRDFVAWSVDTYPARRLALVIGDHGMGWRFGKIGDHPLLKAEAAGVALEVAEARAKPVNDNLAESPTRSFGTDASADKHDQLYNAEASLALQAALRGRKLDVIGFDSCLMGMIETTYAFRDVAHVMVASEEYEPIDGWDHNVWLKVLVEAPEMNERSLGRTIVSAYQHANEACAATKLCGQTTLAAIDVDKVGRFADDFDAMLEQAALSLDTTTLGATVSRARRACKQYGSFASKRVFHVDLACFFASWTSELAGTSLSASSEAMRRSLDTTDDGLVFASWAHPSRKKGYTSAGLAIYFPPGEGEFLADPLHVAYIRENTQSPVEFVSQHRWSDFLQTFFRAQK